MIERALLRLSACAWLGLMGCRPDAGVPDYSGQEGLRSQAEASDEALPGDTPFDPTVGRLAFGVFYEGDRTEEIVVNEVDTHYYIFAIEGSSQLTYSQETSGERIEGTSSDAIVLTGTPWWGGGLIWDNARDLGGWRTLHIGLRSEDEGHDDVEISVQFEGADGGVESRSVPASAYGFINDGSWYVLEIPLADFTGFDLSRVRSPLIIGNSISGNSGEVLLVDDFYYAAD